MLPAKLVSLDQWRQILTGSWTPSRKLTRLEAVWPTTRDVFVLRKLLDGLVVGRVDRNPGELTAVCPVLYQQALQQLYSEDAGYKEIFPPRTTAASMKGLDPDEANTRMKAYTAGRSTGEASDVVRVWRRIYTQRGWGKYATFDPKGTFNVPYLLFKAKNITDPATRVLKYQKCRPIAPGTPKLPLVEDDGDGRALFTVYERIVDGVEEDAREEL